MISTSVRNTEAVELCSEVGIRICPANEYPEPGETRAVYTIQRIINRHGIDHARLVMMIFAECRGNQALADETSIWAVSDLLRAVPDLVEERTSDLLALFDELPLGLYLFAVGELSGTIHKRYALAGMLYLHLRELRPDTYGAMGSVFIRKRIGMSEREKGRSLPRYNPHLSLEEKIEIGEILLEIKATTPRGQFGPWIKNESGYPFGAAVKFMRLAREAA